MRRFDDSCLAIPGSMEPALITRIRDNRQVSQPVFARYPNPSESKIERWETGERWPSGVAIKLPTFVQKHGLKMLAWPIRTRFSGLLTVGNTSGLYSSHRCRLGDNLEAPAGRCVFSATLNGQTLGMDAGHPPIVAGSNRVNGWRAFACVLRSPITLFDDLVTTLFPDDCRCCAGPLLRSGPVPVCDRCVGRVQPNALRGCNRCGDAFTFEPGSDLDLEDIRFAGMLPEGLLCRECRLVPPEFDGAVSFGVYDGELRSLLQLLKFDAMPKASALLAEPLATAILQLQGRAAGSLLVIAVPLHTARERQRGYNQSVLLAQHALRRLRMLQPEWQLCEAHGALVRRRRTESQYVLSSKGRRRNLRGAFHVAGEVAGREILLVDDILTSGATARECARVLKAAGAARVWVATVARAQKLLARQQHQGPEALIERWDTTQLQVQ